MNGYRRNPCLFRLCLKIYAGKVELIIMETDEENMCNGANTAIPAIVVGIIVIAVILHFTVL